MIFTDEQIKIEQLIMSLAICLKIMIKHNLLSEYEKELGDEK